jgi:hypothetical protein
VPTISRSRGGALRIARRRNRQAPSSRLSHRPFDRQTERAPSDLWTDNTMRKATASEKRRVRDGEMSAARESRPASPRRSVSSRKPVHVRRALRSAPSLRVVRPGGGRCSNASRPYRCTTDTSRSFGGTLGRLPQRWKIGEIEKPIAARLAFVPTRCERARHLEACRSMQVRSKPSLDVRGSHDSLRGRTRAVARPRDGSRRVIRANG